MRACFIWSHLQYSMMAGIKMREQRCAQATICCACCVFSEEERHRGLIQVISTLNLPKELHVKASFSLIYVTKICSETLNFRFSASAQKKLFFQFVSAFPIYTYVPVKHQCVLRASGVNTRIFSHKYTFKKDGGVRQHTDSCPVLWRGLSKSNMVKRSLTEPSVSLLFAPFYSLFKKLF